MSTKSFSIHTKKYKLVLSAVHMVYRLINSTYNVRELSLRLTRLLCQFIHASACSVYLIDSQKRKILMIASFNNKINTIQEKRMDFSKVPPRERSVAEGASLFEKRFIGMPLVAEDTMGAIMIWRGNNEPEFEEFDREMMMVFCEQAVTAIKNLQLSEQQQKVILGSMRFIGKMMERDNFADNGEAPVYCKIMKIVAHKMGLKQEAVESLEYAGLLHETGAIDVPFEILSKTSQLTAEEFKIIREHPARCVALIKPVEFLRPVLPIILYRHEKYDGRGYPSGLKGEQIPVGARVMAVVDAFEAMISHRSYRLPMTIDEALLELKRNSGTQFDPGIIEVFGELSKQKKFRKYLSLIKR